MQARKKSPVVRWILIGAGVLVVLAVGVAAATSGDSDEVEQVAATTVATAAPSTSSTSRPDTTTSTTAKATTTTKAAPATTAAQAPSETASQRNARRKAADYLRFTAFSRSGLIEQLKYEGYSDADAAYGTDAQNADWNAQAAKKAAQYLDFMPFSRSGLYDQLIFEGFTPSQAEYGVSTTGL